MCAVSVIHDYMRERVPVERWTPSAFDLFQEVLGKLGELDVALSDPDCEDPQKAQYLDQIRERLAKP